MRLDSENQAEAPNNRSLSRQGKRYALKHGIHAVTKLVKVMGSDRALDKRTAMGKALERWRQELIEDMGGEDSISAQQRAIVDLAVKNKLILDSVDRWIFQQPSLIDKRKRALLPVIVQRQQLADGLSRYMSQLGLERRHKVKSLQEILSADQGNEKGDGKAD
jgi:hypothetical protein